jgi:hypothetical protein
MVLGRLVPRVLGLGKLGVRRSFTSLKMTIASLRINLGRSGAFRENTGDNEKKRCVRRTTLPAIYCFLKALMPNAKRMIPEPSRIKVTGQGKGQPKSGLGVPV